MSAIFPIDRVLMCAPNHFRVDYVINPWMAGNVNRSSPQLAATQWRYLRDQLKRIAEVIEIVPQESCPDMVFTANAGLVIGKTAVPSRFMHPERRQEEPYFTRWFEAQGYDVQQLPENLPFEGAGDALLDRTNPWLWAGYGFRTELQAHDYLSRIFDVEVLSLRLVDNRFYHLDTCFCPLADGYLMYYPRAFDETSNKLIERRVPASKRIVVQEQDALRFACNATNIGQHIILNHAGENLTARLWEVGFTILETPLSEFMKAGGASKCLTLKLDESIARGHGDIQPYGIPKVETCVVSYAGHLLDGGTLSRALDCIIQGGGSFQILEFDLGRQRHDQSRARVRVSAPGVSLLEAITAGLIKLGGAVEADGELTPEARLVTVTQVGVAPDDFYVTDIYPTEVCVKGGWLRVQNQRMDGVIAVDQSQAWCKLLRDLKPGDAVVVGVEGIRTLREGQSGEDVSDTNPKNEFTFMASGISSERRVELAVENIAWELSRCREQGAKVVVVAGPVVVHTGGGPHLASLIRDGYVGTLLAGNALAVHDIEHALYGTTLGVDFGRGVPVTGGHSHHLRAINLIRRCGGIRQAVENGTLKSGVMYECIQRNVAFALAGSIRDDGPLPDTQMDLIQAQADYAELMRGARMVLMLSSMLHSIGVGNMTPAGVKLVCVDINPAVVTKLSDRGSLESVGIVTDVGLFLSLLTKQLASLRGEESKRDTAYS